MQERDISSQEQSRHGPHAPLHTLRPLFTSKQAMADSGAHLQLPTSSFLLRFPAPSPKRESRSQKLLLETYTHCTYPRRTHCAYPTVVVVGSLLRNHIAPDCSACPTKCCDALGCSGPHARCTVGAIEFFFGWKARVILRITSCTFSRSICTLLTFLIATGYGTRFAARGGNYIPHHH